MNTERTVINFKRAFLCVLLVCMALPAMGVTAVLFAWTWSMVK
jgi:hypothetical protein